jgi:tetratricopeptide (TPR) repeat protein
MLGREPGREAAGLRAYRAAVAAGHEQAWIVLGLLLGAALTDPDDMPDLGHVAALVDDAVALEAEYRAAIADGDDRAWRELGLLLAVLDRGDEAIDCFRACVQAGEIEMLVAVGMHLAMQPGGRPDAEQALRLAVLGEQAQASLFLGALLTDQPGRSDEAEAAYRAAIAAGLDCAWCGLAVLLARQPGRPADLAAAVRACPIDPWPV